MMLHFEVGFTYDSVLREEYYRLSGGRNDAYAVAFRHEHLDLAVMPMDFGEVWAWQISFRGLKVCLNLTAKRSRSLTKGSPLRGLRGCYARL